MNLLQEFGTVSFDFDFMRKLIGFGGLVQHEDHSIEIVRELDPTILQLGLWIATVPEIYRSDAIEAAHEVFENWKLRAVGDNHLGEIVYDLQTSTVRRLLAKRERGEL